MRINHDIAAINTHRQLKLNSENVNEGLEKLSKEPRTKHVEDDGRGVTSSQKLRAQIQSLEKTFQSAQDGISLLQTVEESLYKILSLLQQARNLVEQSARDINKNIADRKFMQKELNVLLQEINSVVNSTKLNTRSLIDGSFATELDIDKEQSITISINPMDTKTLGVEILNTEETSRRQEESSGIHILTKDAAIKAVEIIDQAITQVSTERLNVDTIQSDLERVIYSSSASLENLMAIELRIRDVDKAKKIMKLTKENLLTQTAQALSAQLHQIPEKVYRLLR